MPHLNQIPREYRAISSGSEFIGMRVTIRFA